MESIFSQDKIKDTLERLIQNLPGFVYRCKNDKEWTMLFVSNQCYEVTGYQTNELIANNLISFNQVIAPEYRHFLHSRWNEILRDKSVLKEEYQIIRKDGSRRWVLEQGRGVFDDSTGELLYLDGYITDINDKKTLFDSLNRANSLKSAFLANLSHEIRTPVNAILGFSELLKQDESGVSGESNYLSIISSSTRSLLRMLDDIVVASRIETQHLDVTFEKIKLKESLSKIYKHLSSYTRNNGNIPLIIDERGITDQMLLITDFAILKDLLLRLLSNALKYSDKMPVTLSTFIQDKKLFISVADSGIGIDNENIGHVFESFYKIDNDINTNSAGAGLGLYICKNYVELLNGSITITSSPGKGTIVTITFPVLNI